MVKARHREKRRFFGDGFDGIENKSVNINDQSGQVLVDAMTRPGFSTMKDKMAVPRLRSFPGECLWKRKSFLHGLSRSVLQASARFRE